MHLSQLKAYRRLFTSSALLLLLFATACSIGASSSQQNYAPLSAGLSLPGQQIWKQGASSFLFGTNDTYEWSQQNIQTEPAIQAAIKAAGFTLIRTFFPDNASNADIEKRISTIESSGASCLGVITNISNTTFDQNLVRYLGKRCLLYEFGNEPDYNNISIDTYLKQWNTLIPLLRQINPDAKFIGPVLSNDQGNGFMQSFLDGVKASKVLPDAISFHWYPCYNDSQDNCLGKANTAGLEAKRVGDMVKNTLGKQLPIGITEWNYDPGNPPPPYGDNADFMTKFTNTALQSMIQAGVSFACQFDAASYSGYGRLDMFDVSNNQPKAQYYAIKTLISNYRESSITLNPPSQTTNGTATPAATGSATPNGTPGADGTPISSGPWTPSGSTGPLISRGKSVYCSANNDGPNGPGAIVNGHYGNWSFWHADKSALPSWCAIHVGAGASRLLFIWNSDYATDYITTVGSSPQDYTIAVSSNSTNGSNGNWQTVVNVTGNHTRTREHLLSFSGFSWVKMIVTQVQPQADSNDIKIDQIDLYDVSSSAALNDTFFFSGDSITAMAYTRSDSQQPAFAENVNAAYPSHFPAMINGGIGGADSSDPAQNIDTWLALNPDMHYWCLQWGTNDAFNMVSQDNFRAHMQLVIDKIKAAGRVPILASIPYMNKQGGIDQEIQSLNAVIDQLTKANGLIAGPNNYQAFQNHPEFFISDGIHPSAAGAIYMSRSWFLALQPYLYK